ncbi:hypothetical protein K488DRAFT_82720 [Vararia minispora EC-137]|uniref:Uncharacterized protein n=1 Tax=Vararia minispora EC-137 TaxID=1314806 RepID=A0ACB8QVL1_9AGAM|nr:hypothetical protein K488DRAFT_82720 [Vararia minispora EC-137]
MAVMLSDHPSYCPPNKKRRRTATSVCAGDHDPRPRRDVLTSMVNGVPPSPEAEMRGIENGRRGLPYLPVRTAVESSPSGSGKKRGRPPKVRPAPPAADVSAPAPAPVKTLASVSIPTSATPKLPAASPPAFDPSIYGTRPHVHLPQDHRSRSFSPPNMGPPSRPSTPGPSISSSTTRTSSKRPHTPDDGFLIPAFRDASSSTPEPTISEQPMKRPPRKKRNTALRKGWKGWVEISEDEEEASTKLISSEAPLILSAERRTRSGRVV